MSDTFYANWPVCDLNAEMTHRASEANAIGDLLWWDAANACLRSASQFPDKGTQASTLQAFALVFAGVANSKQLAADATAENARDIMDRLWEFPIVAGTYALDTMVAPNYTATGAGVVGCLSAQQLLSVTDPSQAIGATIHHYTASGTMVKCRLTSRLLSGLLGFFGLGMTLNGQANFRNLVDAGDFTTNPFQRGATFTAIANTLTYTADRFFAVGGASSSISVSQQAQTDVVGFGDSLRWGRGGGTNTAQINLGQVLETADSIRMQGRQVTLSFWAKAGAQFSAAGSALTVQVISGTGTNQSAANMIAGTWTTQANVINTTQVLTTLPVRYTFTGTVPAACTQLGIQFSYAPTGTNNSTDTVDFYGIQLEDGPVASLFEHRDIEVELALCQRYYVRFPEVASATFAIGVPTSANNQTYAIWLPTPMRVAPTVTVTVGGFKINTDGAGNGTATGLAAGAAHSTSIITLVTTITQTAEAHVNALVGSLATGFIEASADF